MAATRSGGYSETKDATEEIQKICDEVRPQVAGRINMKIKELTAVKYREQVVKGTNYLIMIHVGGGIHLLIKVWKRLECEGGKSELTDIKNHNEHDPIIPF